MSNRPDAFCYEDSLIIAEKNRAIEAFRLMSNELSRNLKAAKAEIALLKEKNESLQERIDDWETRWYLGK